MQDWLNWNISLGRWFGLQVRVHALFLALGIAVLPMASGTGDPSWPWYALCALGVLFVSVLAHELAHVYAARRLGGSADRILLWPLGGLIAPSGVHEGPRELVVALAGPAMNWLICLFTIPILLAMGVRDPGGLFNPLSPPLPTETFNWNLALSLTFWINWVLAGFNLLPAFPMDGAKFLRGLLRPTYGYHASRIKAARFSMFTAIALFVFACLVYRSYHNAWAPVALLSIVLFFSSREEASKRRHDEMDDELFGYDFSQGYTSLERALEAPVPRPRPGPLRRWINRRRATRLRRKRELEADEDRRVDAVLVRLHEQGIDGLSAEERSLLLRVSSRYQKRQGQ